MNRLTDSRGWGGFPLDVGAIQLSTQRLRIELARTDEEPPVRLDLEERDGKLVAHVAKPGWLPRLTDGQRNVLNLALAGWYKKAGVAIVQVPSGGTIDFEKTEIPWTDWVAAWKDDANEQPPRSLPGVPELI